MGTRPIHQEKHRKEKTEAMLLEYAGKFFAEESNRTSLITMTSAKVSPDGKYATIYFTVFPAEKEEGVLDFAKRKRTDFKHFIKEKTKLGRIPFVDFVLDIGEKNRQLIDRISNGV